MTSPRDLLCGLFEAAVAAADPALVLPPCLDRFLPDPAAIPGRLVVVGAGKAAAAMAAAVEAWAEARWQRAGIGVPLVGLVVTRYGHGVPTRRIRVLEAAHPVPDAAGEAAAATMLALVRSLTPDDRLLVLLSGGGSALLAAPLPGIDLAIKRLLTRQLLACGAAIDEINCVRKHLSAIKGGRLAAASAAPGLTLAISDVVGDDPAVIASGPTVPDPSSCAEALSILRRYGIPLSGGVRELLESGAGESIKPGDARLGRHAYHVVATAMGSLHAAANVARAAGVTPLILGDAIAGEAREVARVFAGLAASCRLHGLPVRPPCVLLSGGETTVTLRHADGRGGRNSEFLLGLALALQGARDVWALAGDTDGIDGSEDNAGAFVTPDTLVRARERGVDARLALDGHDAWGFFQALGDLLVTGPTRTNVNDFRAILVG